MPVPIYALPYRIPACIHGMNVYTDLKSVKDHFQVTMMDQDAT